MHVINRLYQDAHDFSPATPKHSYMIATVPRSGSTYFAIRLWQTGLLGAPMEYLNLPAMNRQLMPRLGIHQADPFTLTTSVILAYWQRVKQIRTSPNGVFGYKMFKVVFHDIISHYPEVFEDIAPDYVLYLTRKDLVGQAISHSRAIKTNKWFASQTLAEETYDFEHISKCQNHIENEYAYWEQVFLHSGIQPIRVTYEDILQNGPKVIGNILSLMGLGELPESNLPIPIIDKQSDDISAEWRARYELDRAKRYADHAQFVGS